MNIDWLCIKHNLSNSSVVVATYRTLSLWIIISVQGKVSTMNKITWFRNQTESTFVFNTFMWIFSIHQFNQKKWREDYEKGKKNEFLLWERIRWFDDYKGWNRVSNCWSTINLSQPIWDRGDKSPWLCHSYYKDMMILTLIGIYFELYNI